MSGLVSAVVCTYTLERWHDLLAAIKSLQQQTYCNLEIIVVVDHNPDLLDRLREHLAGSGVKVVENQAVKGLSGSKNCGIAAARGEIVAFLDDDAVAAPDWLERMVELYRDDSGVMAVGGQTLPLWVEKKPGWFADELQWVVGCTYGRHPEEKSSIRSVFGGNCSFRRSALEQVGEFLPNLGRIGNHMLTGEETEYCLRLRQCLPGSEILYCPAADNADPAA
jgi:glycosyltransferase involved in cell wall biosynthesis